MNFPFNCPGCGQEIHAELADIGKQILCDWCRRPATVPAPMETVGGEAGTGLPIRFACPGCGRNFATKSTLAGQKIRCSGCGGGVWVPATSALAPGEIPRVVLNASSVMSYTVLGAPQAAVLSLPAPSPAPVPVGAPEEPESPRAPFREQLVSAGESERKRSVAVELPSRAETMEQARQEAAEKEAAATQKQGEKAKREKKKKRKRKSDFDLQETLTLVGGVSVVVGVLGLLAWYLPEFRYFLGGLVAVIGFILYMLGGRSLQALAANEGFFKLMLYRFFPPYQLWFVLRHWDEARDFFAFFVSGALVMAIGCAVVTTSPAFKRAAASEREYRKAVREAVYGEFQPAPSPVAKPAAAKPADDAKK